jgi:hypothetical protein
VITTAAFTTAAFTSAAVVAAVLTGPVVTAPAPPADVAACFDGTCTVTVAGPVEIPLDGRAGFIALSVLDVNPFAVTFALRRTGGVALGAVGGDRTARYGSGTGTLAVHVREIADGTARLEITTTVP